MTKQEFKKYLDAGLGRAVLLLRKEKDPSRFRDPLMEVLQGKWNFSQTDYERELIECMPDAKAFAAQLAGCLLPRIERGEKSSAIPLLISFGYEDAIRRISRSLYDQSYADLLDFTKSGASAKKCPPCAIRYTAAVYQRIRWLRADAAECRQILCHMADLYDYSELPVVPTYKNPFFLLHRRESLSDLLAEIAAAHPHGEQLRDALTKTGNFPPPLQLIPGLTAEDIFSERYSGGDFPRLQITFMRADPALVRAVAERCLSETDPGKKLRLMLLFMFESPMFPLDPAPLIALSREQRRISEKERFPLFADALHMMLGRIRHPSVRQYAAELEQDTAAMRTINCLPNAVLNMRWFANYEAADREAFAALLTDKQTPERAHLMQIFAAKIRCRHPDLPMEVLPTVFADTGKARREDLVRSLLARGALPEELREECCYDALPGIRNLVKEKSV